MIRRLLALTLVASGMLSSAALATLNYTKITYSIPDRKGTDRYACDTNGNPLYEETGVGGQNPLYKMSTAGGVPITIFGADIASRIRGPVTLCDNGDITFQTISANGQAGGAFIRKGGGVILTVRGSSFESARMAPSSSRNGDVAFLSVPGPTGEAPVITRSSGGIIGTLPDVFEGRGSRPSINSNSAVAQAGLLGGALPGGQVISGLVISQAGGVRQTIRTTTSTGLNFRLASSQPRIIENRDAVVFSTQDLDTSGLPTGKRQHKLIIPSPPAAGIPPTYTEFTISETDTDCDVYMNDQYTAAYVASGSLMVCGKTDHLRSSQSFTWSAITALSVGDALDGSIVTSIALNEGSVLADNRVVFHASLADGSAGLYSVLVPEPASLTLLAGSLLVVRRRR